MMAGNIQVGTNRILRWRFISRPADLMVRSPRFLCF